MFFSKIADNKDQSSLSSKMRNKRHNYFMSFVKKFKRPIKILDVGGTQEFWDFMGLNDNGIHITLLNLSIQPTTSANFKSIVGDATDLRQFADNSFDIVFSNSVIEHLFTKENQMKMACEAVRVGKYHFIQTPNYFFPLEPHFLFPGFQFLPKSLRIFLISNFSLGHIDRKNSLNEARQQIDEIQLLSIAEMKKLFPDSQIWEEKIFALTKSFVAHNFI